MTESDIAKLLIEKLLDWPFLLFILVVGGVITFYSQVSAWLSRVSEVELSNGALKFKIGKDEVPLESLDSTITARLREMQEEIEELKSVGNLKISAAAKHHPPSTETPSALTEILMSHVYPMLESNLWLGRYVSTLAKAAAVTEEAMLEFCRSRDDIGLFKDGERWVAALASRLKNGKKNRPNK